MYESLSSYHSLRSLEVITNSLLGVYLAIKHMALTSLTSLNSLTFPFAKVELIKFML